MGSYAGLAGKNTLPQDKEKEIMKDCLKLLHVGGMLNVEEVIIFDKKICLLSPLEPDEKGSVVFWYNYFEDDCWEDGSISLDGEINTNKIGGFQFAHTVTAVYEYLELNSETPCITTYNGRIAFDAPLGWINQILGTKYTLGDRFRDIWGLDQVCKEYEIDFDPTDVIEDLIRNKCICSKAVNDWFAVRYVNDPKELLKQFPETETESFTLPKNTYWMERMIGKWFSESCDKDKTYEEIVSIMSVPADKFKEITQKAFNENGNNAQEGSKKAMLLFNMGLLPKPVLAKIIADAYGKSFEVVWADVKDTEVNGMFDVFDKDEDPVVPKRSTTEFLAFPAYASENDGDLQPYVFSDDDRIYWWTPEGDITFSNELKKWFAELKEEYESILASSPEKPESFLKAFMETLKEADSTYKNICAFRDSFYEFIDNASDERYLAAYILFCRLIERHKEEGSVIESVRSWYTADKRVTFNPARMKIKRYVALMANKQLRKVVFGF